ncbi:tripartite ATP-independent transporter DctP family solute receptor [Aminivibrio pyruvatiphilus]|uniref:Tripartite ATP-independent transporter DctP family solute receptor n=1 Tax=Aminivibrio pyruvatiphilus TaxID=1005740 RepID=A0A4R8MK08_9BACT|nr:DctP family TRAP transporter solute-binding subunit [Aminivibrio pyruvatiphilus]TDY65007.1 tripartite ATP-independent transporter DctP family solute receptor [Aminivibrio pyruvatiphilus]
MKKSGVFLAAVAVFMFLLTGAAFAAVEFKFAHSGSLEHQYQIGAEQFKKLVEEKSGGEMKVIIFPQAQLGGERDLAEGVRMGTIEMSSVAAGNMAGFVPELQVFGVPFLFQTREQVYSVIDGPVGKDLADIMLGKGFVNLSIWEVGFRNITNNIRPVKTPDDMKGLKIRVQESKIWIEFMKSLGAVATPIPFGELYTALQQKVVDGQENPVATIYSMKFYEVQKYLSLTGHTYEPALVVANPKWFNGLDPKHQAILKEAAMEAAVFQRQKLAELDRERFEVIRKAGVEVEENPDKAAFAKATEDLHKVLADSVPEALVQKIKDEVAKVK